MPNYTLIANTQFKNRSFDDLLKPLAMYTQEYNEIENAASDLATKASVWEGMANQEQDPIAYAQYKRYADDLQRQATQLSRTGLNPNSRRDLLNLRQRYSSEITPIEQAYANRKAQADEQRKAMLQNPTLLLSRRADMTSLDDYLRNPELGYEQYSGALLTQQVGQAASAIAKELRDYGKGKPLDGFTRTWLQQHGYTAAEVAQAINNPDSPRSSQILNTLVNNVIADSGVPQWANRATLGQAYNYARQGLWNAVGQTNVQTYTDQAALLAAQEAMHKRVAEHAAEIQAQQMQRANRPQIIPRALRSQQEIEDNTRKINTFIKNGYVKEQDGKYVLTDLGKKVYASPVKVTEKDLPSWMDAKDRQVALRGLQAGHEQSDFRMFLDSLNGGKALYDGKNGLNGGKGNFMPTHAGNLFTKAVKNNSSEVYDMYHSTEYVRQLPTGAYQDAFKQQVMAEPEVLVKRDFNGKNGWKEEKIEKADLKDYKPVRFNYSKYGNTITWVNDKGEFIRTNAPKAVNEQVSSEVMRAFDFENIYSQILHTGRLPKTVWDYSQKKEKIATDKDGKVQFTDTPLTQQQMQAYTNGWYNVMDAIQSMGAMYVAPSTTKTREFGSYDFGSGIGSFSSLISNTEE